MKIVLTILATVAIVYAEPPAPNSQYLPSNQYGPPSSSYGTPAGFGGQTTAILKPNNQYGAPSRPNNQYGAPSQQGGDYLPPNGGGRRGGGYGGGNGGYGGGNGGYDEQSEPANYHFKYDVQDAASGNDFGHEEQRQGDVAQGKYYVLLPDGRRQVVEYVADNEGYKPKISYEQVGGGYGGGGGGFGGGNGGGYGGGNGGGNSGYQY